MLFISPPFGNYINIPYTTQIKGSFTLYEKQSENKDFNILYKKEYSNEKEYLLIKIRSDSSKIVQHQIKLPISSTILDFIILDDLFIFSRLSLINSFFFLNLSLIYSL